MHSHATLMERQPPQKKRLNKVESQFPGSGNVHTGMVTYFRVTHHPLLQPQQFVYLFLYTLCCFGMSISFGLLFSEYYTTLKLRRLHKLMFISGGASYCLLLLLKYKSQLVFMPI
jgi:hypothetical protein